MTVGRDTSAVRLIEKLWEQGDVLRSTIPVVVADNVIDYLCNLNDSGLKYVLDLPCIKPPFDEMWIEACRPPIAGVAGSKKLRMFGYRIYQPDPENDPVWLFEGYVETPSGLGRNDMLDAAFTVDVEGKPRSVQYKVYTGGKVSVESERTAWLIYCAALTISFMHCKNVVSQEIKTGSTGRTKKGKRRLSSYNVLKIDPMRDILRREGGAESNGITRALHICRGHFRRYDRPLFGKTFTGTVWVPAHVRGSADMGEVVKSYEVKSPPIPKGLA